MPYCRAVPARRKQDATVPVKSHTGKSIFCSVKFCRREWKSYFLAELNVYFTFQPWVSKVAVKRWCSSIVVYSIFFFFFSPALFDPCSHQAECRQGRDWEREPGLQRLLTLAWIQRPCDCVLVNVVGYLQRLTCKDCKLVLGKGALCCFFKLSLFSACWTYGSAHMAGHRLSGGKFCKWLTHSWSPPAAKWHAVLPFLSKVKNIIDYRQNTALRCVQNKRHSWAFQELKRYPSITSHSYLCASDFCTWLQYGLLKDLVFFSWLKKSYRLTDVHQVLALWFKRAKL